MLNTLAMLAVFLTDAQQHITADKPLLVKIVQDGIDGASVANYLLVFVGLATCIVIICQTIQTKKAAKAAQSSAATANAQIKMMKDKERARISVEILPIETLEFGSGNNRVMLKLSNFGYTHALNVRGEGDARALIFEDKVVQKGQFRLPDLRAYSAPLIEPLPFEFEDIGIPSVILANSPPIETWIGFIFPEEWEDEILLRPRIAIEVCGTIEYEDMFGDGHTTKFSYDMRIAKWGNVSPSGSAPIRPYSPFSRWFKTIGSPDNEAT
jgi:hypothetical protein